MRYLFVLFLLLGVVGCTKKALMCADVDALEVFSQPPMGGLMEIENDLPPNFTGKVKTCYESGRVLAIASYKDRIKHGEEIEYFDREERVLRSQKQYKNGRLFEGVSYCLNGDIDWKFTTDKSGVSVGVRYHTDGDRSVSKDRDDKPYIHVIWSSYKGVSHGVYKEYYETEKRSYGLQVQGEYRNGFREGWWFHYDKNEMVLWQDKRIVLTKKID